MVYVSQLLAIERATGKLVVLAQVGYLVAGGDAETVSREHETLRGPSPDGEAMRARFAAAVYIIDNSVRTRYEFPDAAALALQQKQREIQRARKELAFAESAHAATIQAAANVAYTAADLVAARELLAELDPDAVPTPIGFQVGSNTPSLPVPAPNPVPGAGVQVDSTRIPGSLPAASAKSSAPSKPSNPQVDSTRPAVPVDQLEPTVLPLGSGTDSTAAVVTNQTTPPTAPAPPGTSATTPLSGLAAALADEQGISAK